MELVFTGEFPPMIGGIGNYIYSRCKFGSKNGLRILAAQSKLDENWDLLSGLNIKRFQYSHGAGKLSRIKQLWWSYNALRKELLLNQYRVVTVNVPLPFGWAATSLKQKYKHKVAILCTGNDIVRPMF